MASQRPKRDASKLASPSAPLGSLLEIVMFEPRSPHGVAGSEEWLHLTDGNPLVDTPNTPVPASA